VTKEQSFIFLILVIGGIIVAGFCFAQGTGISVSPLIFELTANPGDIIPPNTVKIYNPTDNIISIKMEAEDWKAEGETGQVIIEPDVERIYSLKSWIRWVKIDSVENKWVKIDPPEFILEPKQEEFVSFIIEVPENAEPGGKYGSILPATTRTAGNKVTGTAVALKVGALLLLTVSGETKESLAIKDFTTPSSFFEYGPVPFTIRFENSGTIHEKPKGFITITNWRDKKVADIEFPQMNVIPNSVRKIEASWQRKWLFGKYTAMVVGSYGKENFTITSDVLTFWVIPWRITLVILVVLVLVLLFFYKTRKRWQLALKILLKGE
jgi:hypothetical protein